MPRTLPYILVAIGGALGALARYLVARWIGAVFTGRFPLATFAINISGSLLLGILGYVVAQRIAPSGEAWRLALGVGFLGAYTTFSTFEYETHALLEDGLGLTALLNVVLSVAAGLVAVRAGIIVARWWLT